MKLLPSRIAVSLALAAGLACEQPTPQPPGNVRAPEFFTPDASAGYAHVSGYVWDPEAYWYILAECGPECPFPPLTVPTIPAIDAALVQNAQVALFDTAAGGPAYFSDNTRPSGLWEINGVATYENPEFPLLALVLPAETATPQLPTLDLPWVVPTANYLPTLVLKPIYTGFTNCMGQSAPMASDKGALEAVALYLNQTTPTGVGDFLDANRFGGVLISWAFAPSEPVVRVPADATAITASAGTVYYLDWAPPGTVPNQSARGFFVAEGATSSPLGLSVLVLPAGHAEPVELAVVDPVTDDAFGRPWGFAPLPPVFIPPEVISYLEYPADLPGATPVPLWVCLTPADG